MTQLPGVVPLAACFTFCLKFFESFATTIEPDQFFHMVSRTIPGSDHQIIYTPFNDISAPCAISDGYSNNNIRPTRN